MNQIVWLLYEPSWTEVGRKLWEIVRFYNLSKYYTTSFMFILFLSNPGIFLQCYLNSVKEKSPKASPNLAVFRIFLI